MTLQELGAALTAVLGQNAKHGLPLSKTRRRKAQQATDRAFMLDHATAEEGDTPIPPEVLEEQLATLRAEVRSVLRHGRAIVKSRCEGHTEIAAAYARLKVVAW